MVLCLGDRAFEVVGCYIDVGIECFSDKWIIGWIADLTLSTDQTVF